MTTRTETVTRTCEKCGTERTITATFAASTALAGKTHAFFFSGTAKCNCADSGINRLDKLELGIDSD